MSDDEIERSPMERMEPPKVEPPLVPVLRQEQIKALLRACEGREFADRRDMAVVRLFLSTGMRRAAMAGLQVHDVDLERRVVVIRYGKGDRPRVAASGMETRKALRRYLAERDPIPGTQARCSGSGDPVSSPPMASATSSSGADDSLRSTASIPTSFATQRPTNCSPTGSPRRTSSNSWGGDRRRCFGGTVRAPLRSGRSMRITPSPWTTGTEMAKGTYRKLVTQEEHDAY